MIWFIFMMGLFVGAAIGIFAMVLCNASGMASRAEEDEEGTSASWKGDRGRLG